MTGSQDGREIAVQHLERLAHELRELGLVIGTARFPCLEVAAPGADSVVILVGTESYWRPVDRDLERVGSVDGHAPAARTIRDHLTGNGGKR